FSLGTSCGTTACQAGACIAPTTPLRNVNSSRLPGVAMSSVMTSANAPEITAIASSVPTRNFRRSTRSATAPAGIARRNIGSVAATCTSATMNGSGLRLVISQPDAALYIQPPMFETMVAIHSAVKLAYRKGPRRERAGGAEAACGLTSLLMRQPKAGIWCFHSRSHWACHETQGDRRLWNGPQPVLQLPPNPAQDHVRLRSRCMLAESDVQSISPDSSRMISGGCIAWHF